MRVEPKEKFLAEAALAYAFGIAKTAACDRAQHGCVLTTPDLNIVAYGYNGPASGLPNQCERPTEQGNCGCVHAEQNACIKAPPGPKFAFITMQPCERCAACLVNAGVELVVYGDGAHREVTEGTALLDRIGIPHGRLSDLDFATLGESDEEDDLSTPEGWNSAKARRSAFAE